MNVLDLLLLLAAASFAFSGYRQGLVVGALALVGFLGGGFVGMLLAPALVARVSSDAGRSLLALLVVLLLAGLGQLATSYLGGMLRAGIRWHPARLVDATLGAVLSVVALLVVAWFLATSLQQASLPGVTSAVRGSAIVQGVDRVMPESARTLFSSFRNVLDENGLPQVFGGLDPERIAPVDPPDPAIARSARVQAAKASVVKVTGTARACSRRVEGTGFVYAPQRVMTNAHVVAGVRRPRVQVGGAGREYRATVVLYDSRRDLAVLHVPGLDAPALRFQPGAARGDSAIVAGFPNDGPYDLGAARVREEFLARGPDIYERRTVTREVLSLLADVQPGNSGGPLLSLQGNVYGVIFAKSLDDPRTGYALTLDEAAPVAALGRDRTAAVGTGGCT